VDDGSRRRSVFLVAFAIAACHAPESVEPVGLTGAQSYPSSVPVEAGPPPGPSPLPPDFRASFAKLNHERFPSRGHLHDRFLVDVYANAIAKDAMGSGKPMPAGAILAKDQYERASIGGAKLAGVLAMEKKNDGAWRWIVIDASGQVVKEGAIEACATCHAEASGDSVFPIAN
jgi:hypothetical protein